MPNPPTRYARSNAGYVAYQTLGEGPRDLLFVANWASNLDAMWDEPSLAHYFHRLGRVGRVICFDKRGSGVSDPVPLASLPTLEEWMDDARIVLDAVGSEQAAVIGDTEGGPMAMLLAATRPSRVSALVLVNSFARWRRAPDYPIGMPDATVEKLLSLYERHWGQDPDMLGLTAPSIANDPADARVVRPLPAAVDAARGIHPNVRLGDATRRAIDPAGDLRTHARDPPRGEPALPRRLRSVSGRAHSRGSIRRAPRRGLLPVPHGGVRPGARRDPRVPHRSAGGAAQRSRTVDRAVHRHRRLDRPRCRDR